MSVPFSGPSPRDDLALVFRRLRAAADLSAQDMSLLRSGCGPPETHRSGAVLRPARRRLLLAGWAARARITPEGRRQIVGFILPGDPIDLSDAGEPPLYATVAVTRGVSVDASAFAERLAWADPAYAALRTAFAALDRAEAVRHIDHVYRLGVLDGCGAMAHLLLELHERCTAAGLAEGDRFPLQVSQDVLGEALGLSQVHANRVLGQLRRRGLVELGPGWARLIDRSALALAAGAEAVE